MIVLDLQWTLFVLLCASLLAVGGVVWVWRRRMSAVKAEPALVPSTCELLERAPFGVLFLRDQVVQYANPAAEELLRIDPETARALPATDWADLLREDITVARRQAVMGHGAEVALSGRYRNVTFPSGRTARWWTIPLGDLDVVFLLDVSVQERVRQAGQALLSDLGHELRTPIATLLTHLEILGLADVGEDVRRQSLALSRREAQRMSRLIGDMLALGRLEMTEDIARRPLNLLSVVEGVVAQITPRAVRQGVTIEISAPAEMPLVLGNSDRLQQVVLNLLDNALKYGGTDVTITLENVERGVRCAVCDAGPGIPPEHLPYVTRRFYRAAPEHMEGSGLGLAVAQEILRHHGSELEIISPVADGHGTCVGFVLPKVIGEEVGKGG